jgi:hypothetical protein
VYTGLFEELPPSASVDKTENRNRDINLLTDLTLKGDHDGFREKIQKKMDDNDVEFSPP